MFLFLKLFKSQAILYDPPLLLEHHPQHPWSLSVFFLPHLDLMFHAIWILLRHSFLGSRMNRMIWCSVKTQVLEYWWNFIEQTLDIQAPPFTSPEARLLGVPFTPSCQVFGGFWMSREIHEIQKYITNTPRKQQQSQSLWLFLFNVYIILLMEEILHMYIYQ